MASEKISYSKGNMSNPLITVVVPSYNQGKYLDQALHSIFQQNIAVEVIVMDGGSTDCSINIIKKWEAKLYYWRTHKDNGQAAAINEGIAMGRAPYVCWLNSDDWYLPNGLQQLYNGLDNAHIAAPAIYARAWNFIEHKQCSTSMWVEPFSQRRLAMRCIISQPATLIRRTAWDLVGGVDATLHLAMDYDLWWKLSQSIGPLVFIDQYVAVNREHHLTKTCNHRRLHYQEAMQIVKQYNQHVPLKWWLYQPYAVWFKSLRLY